MWWAIFITIVLGPHKHKHITVPQAFSSLGECEQLADKIAETVSLPKKARVTIACGRALGGGDE